MALSRPIRARPVPYCPECGAMMVLRRPKRGRAWEPFWGCSRYPNCFGTRRILPDGCPEEDDAISDDGEEPWWTE